MCCFNDHGDNLLEQEAIMVTLVMMQTIYRDILSRASNMTAGNPDNDNDNGEW